MLALEVLDFHSVWRQRALQSQAAAECWLQRELLGLSHRPIISTLVSTTLTLLRRSSERGKVEELQVDQEPANPDRVLCDLGQGAYPLCVLQRPVHFITRILWRGFKPLLSFKVRASLALMLLI